jgi:hypothetical protein
MAHTEVIQRRVSPSSALPQAGNIFTQDDNLLAFIKTNLTSIAANSPDPKVRLEATIHLADRALGSVKNAPSQGGFSPIIQINVPAERKVEIAEAISNWKLEEDK